MTSWLGLLSVFADVVILVALAIAMATRKLSSLARAVIATFAFACAWLLAAGFAAMGDRGWTIFLGAAVIVVSLAAITATLHRWTQCDDDPSWWPDFERQFADYVADREHYI
jgi:hypothetical protein